jgi:hypothetical protein
LYLVNTAEFQSDAAEKSHGVGKKMYGAAEKLYGAAEKSHGVGQKFYAAALLQSATAILQFFNSSTCGLGAGSRAGKMACNCLIMRLRVRRAGSFPFIEKKMWMAQDAAIHFSCMKRQSIHLQL